MEELLKFIIDILSNYLKFEFILILLIILGTILMWHLYLRNKLLKEQVEFEKTKREEFSRQIINVENTYKIEHQAHSDLKIKTDKKSSNRVLIVEDEATLRHLFKLLFSKFENTEVFEAGDGMEALEKVKEIQPTILITDIVMPRMSGIDLVKEVRNIGLDIPIIVISGYYTQDSFLDSKIGSFENITFMIKPFSIPNFMEIIKDFIK